MIGFLLFLLGCAFIFGGAYVAIVGAVMLLDVEVAE